MDDLTLTEAMTDPLIGLVLEADGIDKASFADCLEQARQRFINQGVERLREERAIHFYRRIENRLQ
jgi:hypothetical protein